MKKSGIYSIINIETGQRYIGSSSDIDGRISRHLYHLKNNNHPNNYLQNSWNKYGECNFIFHIIEFCQKDKCLEYEQIYIDGLNPEFNISLSASAPMKDRTHSKETIEKLSGRTPWNKNVKRTEEEKRYMSFRKKEELNKKPPEFFQKISDRSREYIEKNGAPFKGKHHTEENKKYLRSIRKSKRKILCITTGEIFEAKIDIARKYNIRQGHISENLNNKRASIS